MQKNPALALAFHRISMGFLVESIAFYLIVVPSAALIEPFVTLFGAILMMTGYYLAAREESGFKNTLFLKIIVVALLFSRALLVLIFGSTQGLGILITAAQVLLDLFCLHYICIAIPLIFPSIDQKTTSLVQFWAFLHAAAYLAAIFPGEGQLKNVITFIFMIAGFIYRFKYFRYLRAAKKES